MSQLAPAVQGLDAPEVHPCPQMIHFDNQNELAEMTKAEGVHADVDGTGVHPGLKQSLTMK